MSETLTLDPKKTALVLIDLQNGTVSSETIPYSASEVMERSRKLADAFRAKHAPVVYVRVLMTDFLPVPADEPTILPKDLPADVSEIAESVGRQSGDLLITKRHWGAFAGTELERELRDRGVETVVLTGIATNMGVESTLRQGTGLGFAFVTVEDACSTFSREMQDFAFSVIFPLLSNVRTTQEVLEAIGQPSSLIEHLSHMILACSRIIDEYVEVVHAVDQSTQTFQDYLEEVIGRFEGWDTRLCAVVKRRSRCSNAPSTLEFPRR